MFSLRSQNYEKYVLLAFGRQEFCGLFKIERNWVSWLVHCTQEDTCHFLRYISIVQCSSFLFCFIINLFLCVMCMCLCVSVCMVCIWCMWHVSMCMCVCIYGGQKIPWVSVFRLVPEARSPAGHSCSLWCSWSISLGFFSFCFALSEELWRDSHVPVHQAVAWVPGTLTQILRLTQQMLLPTKPSLCAYIQHFRS